MSEQTNSSTTPEAFDLVSGEAVETTPAKKPRKPKTKPAAEAPAEKPAKKPRKPKAKEAPAVTSHGNGAAFSEQRPGIIAYILSRLYKATEKEPVTKAMMYEEVVKEFKDRSASSLHVTVNAQMVPCRQWADRRIKLCNVSVGRAKGFWLPADETLEKGRERKKEEAAAAKAAAEAEAAKPAKKPRKPKAKPAAE
jgi:hypothetical protein